MPAFAPLATSNEKTQIDVASLWAPDTESMADDEHFGRTRTIRGGIRPKTIIGMLFNSTTAHYVKLLVLCVLAAIHLIYMNDYIEKFAIFDELTTTVEIQVAPSDTKRNDIQSVLYTMHAFIDYKKNLWMTVGAMCASLATTACLLLQSTSSHNVAKNRLSMAAMKFFDLCSFALIITLLFTRITAAVTIEHMTQHALRAADRLIGINEIISQLNCSLETRDGLQLCSHLFISSIFPVKVIEYLIILCILTGAYIGLAYLIQWCIRHFFPPTTHQRMNAISAISRNMMTSSSIIMPEENLLMKSENQ